MLKKRKKKEKDEEVENKGEDETVQKNKCENFQQKRRVFANEIKKNCEARRIKEIRYYERKHITQNKCKKHETN